MCKVILNIFAKIMNEGIGVKNLAFANLAKCKAERMRQKFSVKNWGKV